MTYQEIYDLPQQIQDRMFMDEHADLNGVLAEKYGLRGERLRTMLFLENDILFQTSSVNDLSRLFQERLGLSAQTATQIATELWGGYFLFFQDFLGKVDELITQNGGDLKKYQDRVRQLLSPHRQLQEFVTSYLYDFHLEMAGDAARNELIDIMLDRALGKLDKQGLVERLRALFAKARAETRAEDVADAVENLFVAGDISQEWAEYYINLAENVLSGKPSSMEQKAAPTPPTLRRGVGVPTAERVGKEKTFLTNEEIKKRLQEIETEADVSRKLQDAKSLLAGIDLHAMRKAEMYDKITHAESLLQHHAQSQNSLEKKAIQDELHDLMGELTHEIKASAEAPASTEEIQKALRDLKNE